jgi:hypothetical protein
MDVTLRQEFIGLPEENMMSQRSKREPLEEIGPRYLKAKKTEKTNMLDEFVAATSYHRKYATRLLKNGRPRRIGRKPGLVKGLPR